MKKLRDVEAPLANFFASGVLALREKLGPVLWQLPPTLGFDADRLRAFFALLPRSTGGGGPAGPPSRRADGGPGTARDRRRPAAFVMPWRCGTPRSPTPASLDLLREHAGGDRGRGHSGSVAADPRD